MKTMRGLFVWFFFFCFSLGVTAQTQLNPVDYASLSSFPSPMAVKLSPDGRYLLYSTFAIDSVSGAFVGESGIMTSDGKKTISLPSGTMSVNFTPDSRGVTYICRQTDGGQLFRMEIQSRAVEQLSRVPGGISNYILLPDESGLIFSTSVYAVDSSPEYAARMEEERKERKHVALVYDHLLMRPYFRWDDGRVSHVFLYRFDTQEIRDLTPGPFSAPTSHLGSRNDLAVSPDGRTLAYTTNTDPVKALSTNNDIYLVDLEGRNRRQLTSGKGNDCFPVFSPDGRYLAYTEMATPGYESEQKDLILVDLKTDARRNLTIDLDFPVEDIIWSRRGDAIFVVCKEKGYDSLYHIDLSRGEAKCLVRDKVFSSVALTPGEKSFFCITSNIDRPAELARYDLRRQQYIVLTDFADEFLRNHALGKSEVIWFEGAKGDQVMAFVTLPPAFDPEEKYPVVFLIHGGPELDWDGSWSNYGGNSQHFAAEGYIVVKPNLHAAQSYGRSFQEAILNNWGIVDQVDIEKCIDYLCSTRPYVDGNRIGAMGRSYGGFLANWLNGNSRRFSCFVTIDGCFDQLMMYYSTDELWFPEKEFGGSPVENRDEYLRSSPSTYVQNFKTPTLVLHGGRDYRVDLSQGIGMFTALQRQGVPSRLIVFPDEGHYYRSRYNWEYAYQEIFAWFDKYLKNKGKQ